MTEVEPAREPIRQVIHARRVRLQPLDRAAAVDLLAGGDGGLVARRGWPHDGTLDAARAALASEDVEALPWVVVVLDDGEPGVIGDLGWRGAPGPDGEVEIGYGLAAPYRGRGYGTEAVAALLQWLDERPDVRLVWAEVLADNVPSRRLLTRLGFSIDHLEGGYVWYARRSGSGVERQAP